MKQTGMRSGQLGFGNCCRLIKYVPSENGKQVGVIIANMGGGGPGYCRDLVYKFPNKDRLPDFSKEKNNRKYLVKEVGCGEAKEIRWKNKQLIINYSI